MSLIHVDGLQLSLSEVAEIVSGELFYSNPKVITSISLDSRQIEEGSLFIAIKGERFDGHEFIGKAFELGASCIVAERIPYKVKGNIILVDSTLEALGALARYQKERLNPFTVAITGSVGKTTTKQFVYSVLNQKLEAHKTDANFNNEIGLPLTIFKMPASAKSLVLECGMSFKGEIARLSKIARPDIAIITNIGTSHIENLGSREGIRDAKMEIIEGLKEDGKLILNGDEPLLANIDGAVYVSVDNEKCDYYAKNIDEDGSGISFDMVHGDHVCKDLRINTLGLHNLLDAEYAYAVGNIAGLSDDEIARGLLQFENVAMRQNIYDFDGKTFIEDCYNASPESMKASLKVLKKTAQNRGARKVAILGNMLELGDYSQTLHRSVGEAVFENGVDVLYCFGNDAAYIAKGAIDAGMPEENIRTFADIFSVNEMGESLKGELKKGDIVLFKASRGVKLERVIEYFKS